MKGSKTMRMFNTPAGHPCIGDQCPLCYNAFVEGDKTTLIDAFPSSEEHMERKRNGRVHNSIGILVHWDCVPEYVKKGE